jgi:hypothetical protein
MEWKWSWPNSRLYPAIGVKGLRNSPTNLGQVVDISTWKTRKIKDWPTAYLEGIKHSGWCWLALRLCVLVCAWGYVCVSATRNNYRSCRCVKFGAQEWCIRGLGVETCVSKAAWKICVVVRIILIRILKKIGRGTRQDWSDRRQGQGACCFEQLYIFYLHKSREFFLTKARKC